MTFNTDQHIANSVLSNTDKILLNEITGKLFDPVLVAGESGEIIIANQKAMAHIHSIRNSLTIIEGFHVNNNGICFINIDKVNKTSRDGISEWTAQIEDGILKLVVADKFQWKGWSGYWVTFRRTEFLNLNENGEKKFDEVTTTFLANTSHEIRTPLNGIIGFAEILLKKEISLEKQRQFIGIIYNNGSYLLKLVTDMLDLSRIEAGKLELYKVKFSINRLLYDLHLFFLMDLKNRKKENISINVGTCLGDGVDWVVADELRIKQVLINLISNALKFTVKGEVSFGYKMIDGNMLEFYVRDTGPGIDKSSLKIIFDRFGQANDTIASKYGGSGLGLSISKEFIELHGGKIWAKSERNEGSTFYFTLPMS